jgi:hypothetical protein
MSSRERHLRHLLEESVRKRNEATLASAYTLIQQHFDEIGEPDVLVRFAEAASYLEREDWARTLMIRCLHEARLGIGKLYGHNLVQQIQYALTFLKEAQEIASDLQAAGKNKDRYGFLIYNATLVFWIVCRPICRPGWQKLLVDDFQQLYELLKGALTSQHMPCPVDIAWRIELALQLAFALEDAGKEADALKAVEDAAALYKTEADVDKRYPWLGSLLTTARCWFSKKSAAGAAVRKDVEGNPSEKANVAVLFVRNEGSQNREADLIQAWCDLDPGFRYILDGEEADESTRSNVKPESQVVLAASARAACQAGLWSLALKMVDRLLSFRAPPPRVRVLIDLSKAQTSVWRACNEVMIDPHTDMLYTTTKQKQREVDARRDAVRLCEQCIMAAKRIEDVELVEESAIVMWNIGISLLSVLNRHLVHKSLLKAAEILNEIDSNLMQLRVQLHLEVAKCEISHDLLTKGKQELMLAEALDSTLTIEELTHKPEGGEDPAPYIRALNHYQIDPMQ